MIGKRLKALRDEAGISQAELAALINVSPGMISKYENDESNPIDENKVKLAKELNTTTDYLLGASDEMHPVAYQIPRYFLENDTDTLNEIMGYFMYKSDGKTKEMLTLWERLPEKKKERYLWLIKDELNIDD